MASTGSAVVKTLERASHEAWKRWRELVRAGRGESPEAIEAYEQASLAGQAWLGETLDRAAARAS